VPGRNTSSVPTCTARCNTEIMSIYHEETELARLRAEIRHLRQLLAQRDQAHSPPALSPNNDKAEEVSLTRKSERETHLPDSRERLILANVRDSVIVTDLDGIVTYWNEGATRLFGWSAEEMVGRHYAHRFPASVSDWFMQHIQDLAKGLEWSGEYEDYRKDGSRVWIDARVQRFTDANGTPVGILGIAHDISAQKKVEQALRQSEERFSKAFMASPYALALSRKAGGQIGNVNEAFLHLFGLSREEVIGERSTELGIQFAPEDRQRVLHILESTGHVRELELSLLRRSGERVTVLASVEQLEIEGEAWLLTMHRDVTAQRRAEAELQESSVLLRAISDTTEDVIYAKDRAGRLNFANPATLALIGKPLEEVIGKTYAELLNDPVAAAAVMTNDHRIMTTGVAEDVEEGVPMPDGNPRVWLSRKMPYRDAEGKVVGLLGVSRDITARKHEEKTLHESKERYRLALDVADLGTWTWDLLTGRGDIDARGAQIVGLDAGDVSDVAVAQFARIHPGDVARIQAEAEVGIASCTAFTMEYRAIHPDGSVRHVVSRAYVVTDETGNPIRLLGTNRDVTEAKQGQAEREQHVREMEALNDQLRRAMTETHHRVKNNLQVIGAMISIQLLEAAPLFPASELERLNTHIQTLAVLHDILTLETRKDRFAQALSVQELLEKTLSLLQQTAPDHNLTFTITDMRLPVQKASAIALITNELVSNGFKHGKSRVKVRFYLEEETAVLEVADDGPGFPEGFDPQQNANTGLDLVLTLSRHDLGGRVLFANPSEGGACVLVTLPRAEDQTHGT
jgi:PAS domain S-box-containing protein